MSSRNVEKSPRANSADKTVNDINTETMSNEITVQHGSLCPVILVGHGSSGTSIFSRLLRNHLRVSFGTESQFIVKYAQRLAQYGDLNDDANLRRLIDDISSERWFQRTNKKFGFDFDPEAAFNAVEERSYRGVLDAIFLQLATHNGMAPRWGDKTPGYATDLPVLGELFPDAKYIHLARDGRDVALSVMGRFWGAQNIYMAAEEWIEAVDSIEAFLQTLPAEQKLEITYEQLLSDPVTTFDQVIAFLEIEPREELLRQLEPLLKEQLDAGNFDKWRTKISPAQRKQFERFAHEQLRRYGYETETDSAGVPPSSLAKMYWRVTHKLRQYTYLDYWKDNVYKVRTLLNDRLRALRG